MEGYGVSSWEVGVRKNWHPFCFAGGDSSGRLRGAEQIIAQQQTENNDADSQKAVGNEKHNRHADCNPE